MAMPNGIPPQLATLLAAQMPQQGPDAKQLAMLQALQGAQGAPAATPQDATGVPSMMPMQGSPGTDSELYRANQAYKDYNPDAIHPEDPSGTPRDRYPADPRSSIDAGEGTYERSPGEDQAAQMAQDAIEGKGTTYPKADSPEADAMEGDATDWLAGQGGMTADKFMRKYGMDVRDFARDVLGVSDKELPDAEGPYDPNQMLRNATEGRRK